MTYLFTHFDKVWSLLLEHLKLSLIPIVVVALAYQVASGFIYLYADAGNSVSSNSTTILVVLMFGVGTDYCLLLVSRYREELHRIEDKHEAMQRALRRAGPALLASGCTVISAMLVLLLAEAGSTKTLGPVSAIGVAAVLLAGMTLLPALLTIAGRRGFERRYALVSDVLPPAALETSVPRAEAIRELVRRAAIAYGVATAADLADYWRIKDRGAVMTAMECSRPLPRMRAASSISGWTARMAEEELAKAMGRKRAEKARMMMAAVP